MVPKCFSNFINAEVVFAMELQEVIECNRSLSSKLQILAEPLLKNSGVTVFGYRHFAPNGNSYGISTNSSWTEFYLNNFLHSNLVSDAYDKELRQVISGDKKYFIRTGAPSPENKLFSALYDANIWNSISMYYMHGSHIEGFYFASSRDNVQMVDFYVNKLSTLHNIIADLRSRLCYMISEENAAGLSGPTVDPIIFNRVKDTNISCDQDKYLLLTHRERECLFLLSRCYTYREIASRFSISTRTVERHIENIKKKTGFCSRSDCVNAFFDILSGIDNVAI